jgi:hypothetical protein
MALQQLFTHSLFQQYLQITQNEICMLCFVNTDRALFDGPK